MGRAKGSLVFLHRHASHSYASPSGEWGPAVSWFWGLPCVEVLAGSPRAVGLEFCWENWENCPGGLGALGVGPVPASVTIPLLIWPQENDVVPPGMESLISAPLVKTSEKEEEQVSPWISPSKLGSGGALSSE